jgi:dolichyl-phosphate beta-glucosyltransferase
MQAQHALIIPVFNGERYILSLFVQLEAFLAMHSDWHVYIVNDGSTDRTAKFLDLLPASMVQSVTVLSYEQNRGKGGAIGYAMGMIPQNVATISYTDIEIPYTFEPFLQGVEVLHQRSDVSAVIGDRTRATGLQYSKYRQIATKLFRLFVPAQVRSFADTQAGCKVFRSDVARRVFGQLQTSRWVFDIEVLSTLVRSGDVVETVPVTIKPQCARGVGGLTFFRSSVSVLTDLFHIRFPHIYRLLSQHTILLYFIALLLLSFLWFGQSLALGFFSDDFLALSVADQTSSWWSYVTTNIFGQKGGGSYGPVWNWIVEAQYSLFGLRASWFHFVSVTVHALNATLLIILLRSLTKRTGLSIAAGVLFLTLVGHVESVVWVASQVHLFATLFLLVGFVAYVRSIQVSDRRWYVLSMVSIALALFTKEISVTSILLLPLIGLWVRTKQMGMSMNTSLVQTLKEVIPVAVSLSTFLVLRYVVTQTGAVSYYGGGFDTLTYYHISQFIIGITLSHVSPFSQRAELWEFLFIYKEIFFVFLAIVAIFLYRKKQYTTIFFSLLYLIALIPYVPLFLNFYSYEGERYGYFPALFFATAIVFCFSEVFSLISKRVQTVFIIGVCAVVCVWGVGSLYTVSGKIDNWRQADQWIAQVFDEAQRLPWDELGYVYVLGLPDSYQGAHLLRNGFVQGMKMLYDRPIVGESPYILSSVLELPDTSARASMRVSCRIGGRQCTLHATEQRIIGFLTSSVMHGMLTLGNVDRRTLLARTVSLKVSDQWCVDKDLVSLVWYDVINGAWSYETLDPYLLCDEGDL